jgi:hypothetical protein
MRSSGLKDTYFIRYLVKEETVYRTPCPSSSPHFEAGDMGAGFLVGMTEYRQRTFNMADRSNLSHEHRF